MSCKKLETKLGHFSEIICYSNVSMVLKYYSFKTKSCV